MGLVKFLIKKLIFGTAVFLLIVFIPGLPPDNLQFTAYSVKPTLPLEGPLALNTKLNGAERLFENEIKGPEGLAIYNGELYTGIHGGHIVKIKNNKIIPVLKFGKACEGLWEEDKCGRVLGLKFTSDGTLYAADPYYGLFTVNMSTGAVNTVIKKDEIINGKPTKLLNSVDVSVDGTIYWTVSSTSHDLNDGMYTLFGDGNGRLIRTDPKKGIHEVLIEKIHFANGVVLSEDESFVLVAETAAARVLRYYLKGTKKGKVDVFIDGLPGLPDNLKRDSKGGFYIPLVTAIDKDKPYLPFVFAPYPLIRKFFIRIISLIELSIKYLNEIYPFLYFKQALHFIGHFESTKALLSQHRVTIIRTNSNGDIIESLHATDGRISSICDIEYFNGAYYLASPFNPYLGRVTTT
ncbi:adipocyte plasma membrane-associated protein Hemomucin-like [Lycorma delicatula]|uniref:adipocyte plasma membrane-associated protein Hemomucin-like n=1 Tax=Lycorma delicatula TaxID=130591 RepID=UPI003F5188A6